MYLKVALRISELESTDNLSSPYNIILSNRAFERFEKQLGCNVEFTLSTGPILYALLQSLEIHSSYLSPFSTVLPLSFEALHKDCILSLSMLDPF